MPSPFDTKAPAPYTQRVEVGTYYTNGERLVRIDKVCALGSIDASDAATGEALTIGISVLRRDWWRVR